MNKLQQLKQEKEKLLAKSYLTDADLMYLNTLIDAISVLELESVLKTILN